MQSRLSPASSKKGTRWCFCCFLPGLMLLTIPRKAFPSLQLRPKSLTSMPNLSVTCALHHWRRAFLAPTFHLSCLPPEGVLLRSSSDSPEAAPPARPTMGEPKRWPSLARMRVFSSILKKEGERWIVNEVTGTRATS